MPSSIHRAEPGFRGAADVGSCLHANRDFAEAYGFAANEICMGKSVIFVGRVFNERKRYYVEQH